MLIEIYRALLKESQFKKNSLSAFVRGAVLEQGFFFLWK